MERLRYSGEDNKLYSRESGNRKAEDKNAEEEKNLEKSEFKFMFDIKDIFQKISVDAKLFQLMICLPINPKEQSPEVIFPVFSELTERSVLSLVGDKFVIPEELKKQVRETLHFGHPGSTKLLAENNTL